MSLHYLALTDEQLARIRAVLDAARVATWPESTIAVSSLSTIVTLTATPVSESKTEPAGTVTLGTVVRARRDFETAAEVALANPYPFI